MNQSVIYELNASDIGCGREYPAAYDTPVSIFISIKNGIFSK